MPEWERLAAEVERLYEAGRYAEAVPLAEGATLLAARELGGPHPDLVRILTRLALLYIEQGRYAEAEQRYLRALSIGEGTLGGDHPDLAEIFNDLGVLYHRQGRYAEAEPLVERALSIFERTQGDDHPDVANSLNNLAAIYLQQDRYAEAEPLHLRALDIQQKALGAEHPDVATNLSNLAMLYRALGRYPEAEELGMRALSMRERVLGDSHPDVATSLNNVAALYQTLGRYAEAEPLYQRALDIKEKALGERHPVVAQSLTNLATLNVDQGNYIRAESLHRRALDIREKALGDDHPDVGRSLTNLATLYGRQGRYEEAESLYRRALGILEKALGPWHAHVALNLDNLAAIHAQQGRYVGAEPLAQRALSIREKILGERHPDVVTSLYQLTRLYLAQQDVTRAIAYAERGERASDELLSAMMRHGSEQQRHFFMTTDTSEVDTAVNLALRASGNARAQRLAMRHLLRRKGRVLDAMRTTLAAIRDHMDDEGRGLLDRYVSIRTQYATQYLRGPQNIETEQYRKNLAALEKQKREIEAQLSAKSSQIAEVNRTVTLDDVQDALPDDAVLIEWIRYEPFDTNAREQVDRGKRARYAACVLARRGAPACLDLGDAEVIDAAAQAFHRAVAFKLESRAPARKLEALVLAPFRRTLGSARTLYLSPDGALQFTPFAALVHRDGDGVERYLVEQLELVYVTGGRDLVRTPRTWVSPGPAAVLGDPRYSAPGTSSSDRFRRLRGTHQEAEEIGALFTGARVLTGAEASEGAVKSVRAPWILHLATHAYFGAQDCAGQPRATDNPLLAAGVALADANACHDGDDDDGVLTGEELAGLDLYGTQLVVLSACDTGIGELALRDEERLIGVRDGVYGLRRALMLAGAETQVVSLWKVSDLATQELMRAYYRALRQGRGRAEALRRVQLDMLRSEKRAHPYYWASFVVVGMDGPLRPPPDQPWPATAQRGPRGCACDVGAGSPAPGGTTLVLVLAVLLGLRRRPRSGLSQRWY